MKRFVVTDTITYERHWRVEAEDEDSAIDLVSDGLLQPISEEQTDNTPYEAEEDDWSHAELSKERKWDPELMLISFYRGHAEGLHRVGEFADSDVPCDLSGADMIEDVDWFLADIEKWAKEAGITLWPVED